MMFFSVFHMYDEKVKLCYLHGRSVENLFGGMHWSLESETFGSLFNDTERRKKFWRFITSAKLREKILKIYLQSRSSENNFRDIFISAKRRKKFGVYIYRPEAPEKNFWDILTGAKRREIFWMYIYWRGATQNFKAQPAFNRLKRNIPEIMQPSFFKLSAICWKKRRQPSAGLSVATGKTQPSAGSSKGVQYTQIALSLKISLIINNSNINFLNNLKKTFVSSINFLLKSYFSSLYFYAFDVSIKLIKFKKIIKLSSLTITWKKK